MLKKIFIIISVVVLTALIYFVTKKNQLTEGYTKIENNAYLKYLKKNDSGTPLLSGDYARVNIKYIDNNNTPFFENTSDIEIQESEENLHISFILKKLNVGDSVSVLINAKDFFENYLKQPKPEDFNNKDFIKVNFNVLSSMSKEEYNSYMSTFYEWVDNPKEYEKYQILDYIKNNNLKIRQTKSGIFFFSKQNGNGKKPKMGETVQLQFEGKTLNGKVFDSTKKRKQLFSYNYGSQMQIIKGLEEAVKLMSENEKALVIIPSWLAFGELGSATGIIPPYTSVVYEIEIKKIN